MLWPVRRCPGSILQCQAARLWKVMWPVITKQRFLQGRGVPWFLVVAAGMLLHALSSFVDLWPLSWTWRGICCSQHHRHVMLARCLVPLVSQHLHLPCLASNADCSAAREPILALIACPRMACAVDSSRPAWIDYIHTFPWGVYCSCFDGRDPLGWRDVLLHTVWQLTSSPSQGSANAHLAGACHVQVYIHVLWLPHHMTMPTLQASSRLDGFAHSM